jgi:Rad3-related DNA helicase
VQIIQGSVEGRQVQYRADALFFVVNYELVLRDLSVIGETLKPDLLILDEAQKIKNWRTKKLDHVPPKKRHLRFDKEINAL